MTASAAASATAARPRGAQAAGEAPPARPRGAQAGGEAPPAATRALWIGPGAARTLRGAGAARAPRGADATHAVGRAGVVELALHPGGYVRFGDDYALLAHPRAPRGPLTVLVAGLEAAPLRPGDPARVEAGRLLVGRHEIALDVTPATPPPALQLRPGWRAALRAALDAAPGPPPELAPGLAALRARDLERAVADLAGRGPGLTPAGDDILAGYAAWLRANLNSSVPPPPATPRRGTVPFMSETPAEREKAGRAARVSNLNGTVPFMSPVGLAYLRCAERGELAEPAARVLAAIRNGDVAGARRAARALGAWGASSGAAILWGLASAT
jgi:hypothetical protein